MRLITSEYGMSTYGKVIKVLNTQLDRLNASFLCVC